MSHLTSEVFSHCKSLAFCSMEKYLAGLLTLNTHFPVYVISGVMTLAFIHPLSRHSDFISAASYLIFISLQVSFMLMCAD